MDKIKKYRLIIVIVLLILIPLFQLSSTIKAPKELRWYDKVILWVTSPVQKTITFGFDSVMTITNTYVFLVNVKKENKKLTSENNRLVEMINNMHEVESENQRLRKLLAFKEKYLPSGVSAEVIARDTTSEYQTIRINKGHDVGLKRQMPVITPAGSVGQINNVWEHFSDVLLMTDRNHAMDTIVQRSRTRGVVKGGINSTCELYYVARTDDIAIGDVLVTSGIEGIFPKGLLVGTVAQIEKKKFGVSQRIEVTPTANLGKLEEVFVVTSLRGLQLPSESTPK